MSAMVAGLIPFSEIPFYLDPLLFQVWGDNGSCRPEKRFSYHLPTVGRLIRSRHSLTTSCILEPHSRDSVCSELCLRPALSQAPLLPQYRTASPGSPLCPLETCCKPASIACWEFWESGRTQTGQLLSRATGVQPRNSLS